MCIVDFIEIIVDPVEIIDEPTEIIVDPIETRASTPALSWAGLVVRG